MGYPYYLNQYVMFLAKQAKNKIQKYDSLSYLSSCQTFIFLNCLIKLVNTVFNSKLFM